MNKRLLITTKQKLKERKSNKLSLRELRTRRKERCKDSETCKKGLRTDNLKLTISGPRELSKRAKDRQD